MTSEKPTLVIVPGSCAPAELYASFADHVRFYGYEVEVVSLPSVGRRKGVAPATMQDDAAQIQSVLKKHVDSGKRVVLVCHSYGGIPATESLKGLSVKERGAGKGGVEKLIYATAMAIEVGTSIASLAAAGENPTLDFVAYTEDGYVYLTDLAKAGSCNFQSMPEEEQVEQAKRLTEHSVASFADALTYPGYLDVPVTYLVATQDLMIPVANQERYIKIMMDAGAKVDVVKFDSDHGWMASRPRSTARIVLQTIDPSL